MQGVNTWLEQRPEKIQNTTLMLVKHPKKELKPHVISLSLNNSPSKSQNNLDTVEEDHSQVKYYLSLIDDPLWKKVCRHVEDMMGPLSVVKIWECKLGFFSSEEHNIEINCRTEEAAQFLKKYAFVILSGLKQYFPALKELKISLIYPLQ